MILEIKKENAQVELKGPVHDFFQVVEYILFCPLVYYRNGHLRKKKQKP